LNDAALSQVCLAVSSYRNDVEVLALLERVKAGPGRFASILLVDSLGSGRMPDELASRGWTDVRYVTFERNLGSAGNLAERLRLAAESGASWVYTVNHDGGADPNAIARLVEIGASAGPRIGAVYPLRRMIHRGDTYDVTGCYRVPLRSVRVKRRPAGGTRDAYWSSSNGALYALAPIREGLLPWADLWMGYEDLGYGWLLRQEGYRQLLALDVEIPDGYEYRRQQGLWLTRKPSWYAYYHARNFLLVARRTRQPLAAQAAVLTRVVLELGVTAALRPNKAERLRYIAEGLIDGLAGRSGKWRLP
jgi:GT2 family glycosyltransferase